MSASSPKIPTPHKTAFVCFREHVFSRRHANTLDVAVEEWNALEDKSHWAEMSMADGERYDREFSVYKAECERLNLPIELKQFNSQTLRKSGDTDAEKSHLCSKPVQYPDTDESFTKEAFNALTEACRLGNGERTLSKDSFFQYESPGTEVVPLDPNVCPTNLLQLDDEEEPLTCPTTRPPSAVASSLLQVLEDCASVVEAETSVAAAQTPVAENSVAIDVAVDLIQQLSQENVVEHANVHPMTSSAVEVNGNDVEKNATFDTSEAMNNETLLSKNRIFQIDGEEIKISDFVIGLPVVDRPIAARQSVNFTPKARATYPFFVDVPPNLSKIHDDDIYIQENGKWHHYHRILSTDRFRCVTCPGLEQDEETATAVLIDGGILLAHTNHHATCIPPNQEEIWRFM